MTETLYRTKTPARIGLADRWYELGMGEEKIKGQTGYYVRETECWWDSALRRNVRVQYTLSPRGGFVTVEEARARYEQQKLFRALRGFVHCFAPRYESQKASRYTRVVIPAERIREEAPGAQDAAAPLEPRQG